MERFTKCPICGASVRTGYMQSLDSREVTGAERPPMSKFDEAEQCFDKALEINPKYPPAARNLAMLENVRKKASKDPWYLKESEDCMREGYF
jgi:tetratricopeptide (TPR) repeat protein